MAHYRPRWADARLVGHVPGPVGPGTHGGQMFGVVHSWAPEACFDDPETPRGTERSRDTRRSPARTGPSPSASTATARPRPWRHRPQPAGRSGPEGRRRLRRDRRLAPGLRRARRRGAAQRRRDGTAHDPGLDQRLTRHAPNVNRPRCRGVGEAGRVGERRTPSCGRRGPARARSPVRPTCQCGQDRLTAMRNEHPARSRSPIVRAVRDRCVVDVLVHAHPLRRTASPAAATTSVEGPSGTRTRDPVPGVHRYSSQGERGLGCDAGQFLGIADVVEAGDAGVFDTDRHDAVDLAVQA